MSHNKVIYYENLLKRGNSLSKDNLSAKFVIKNIAIKAQRLVKAIDNRNIIDWTSNVRPQANGGSVLRELKPIKLKW